jgi:hypothetical protein
MGTAIVGVVGGLLGVLLAFSDNPFEQSKNTDGQQRL